MMNRTRAIGVLLTAALLLLVSADCFGNPPSAGGRDVFCSLRSADRRDPRSHSPADNSRDRAVQRGCRRSTFPDPIDGFSPSASFGSMPAILPELTAIGSGLARVNSGLAKCWQFRWRAALDPRAPSSLS